MVGKIHHDADQIKKKKNERMGSRREQKKRLN